MNMLKELHPEVDFLNEKGLVDDGILDSIDIVELISEICDEYDIEIEVEDIIPENFNSAEAISSLIDRKAN